MVIYRYNLYLPGILNITKISPMNSSVHLAVAGDVFNGVLFCAVLFPRDVPDENWD